MQEHVIKEKVEERYSSIALTGTFESVCVTTEYSCSCIDKIAERNTK